MNNDIDWKEFAMPEGRSIKIVRPPEPNWRCYVGSKQNTTTYYQFYLEKSPNRFQRWMMGICFGIFWEKVQ